MFLKMEDLVWSDKNDCEKSSIYPIFPLYQEIKASVQQVGFKSHAQFMQLKLSMQRNHGTEYHFYFNDFLNCSHIHSDELSVDPSRASVTEKRIDPEQCPPWAPCD